MFTKVAPPCAGAGDAETYFTLNHLSDGNVALTSLKGVDQPKFSYFHRTPLTGGVQASCNLSDSKWSTPITFPSIDADENREDIVFSFGAKLFMLIYSRYECFQFLKLMHWDASKKEWIAGALDTQMASKFKTERAELVYGWDASSGALLTAITDRETGTVYIDRIAVNESGSGKVSNVTKAEDLIRMGHVVKIATDGNRVFLIGGEEMCGFMWQPQTIHVFDIGKKSWTIAQCPEDSAKPPFSWSGPSGDFFTKSGRWVMLGGSSRSGMTGSDFKREVWSLNLTDPKKPKWEKLAAKIPDEIGGEYTSYASDYDKQLFLYSAKNGLYKGSV